jgi:Transglycosylase-like domain
LEIAMREARQFAVEAYVAGGPTASIGEVFSADSVVQAMWRLEILRGQTEYGLERASEQRDLLGRADSAVRQIALRSDQNRQKVEAATLDRFYASIERKRAEQRLVQDNSALFIFSDGQPGTMAEAWARLRMCESSGNYRALSPGGLYRGAYQFDLTTWITVGGTGDPIDASPEEQDMRAQTLYDRRGKEPWPVCGRYLP